MISNPVYQREVMRSIRAPRMILSVFFFNLILGLVGLAAMAILMNNAKSIETMNYTTVIRCYELLATVDAVLILIMTPAQTAGSICYERERNTFDILKVSGISGRKLVAGKLMAGMAVIMTLIISTMPILSLAFVFGGIRFLGLLVIMLVLCIHALYIGSIGIAFSAWSKNITFSMTCTYGTVICITAGSAVLSYMFGDLGLKISAPIMAFNPAYTFALVLLDQVGDSQAVNKVFSMMGTGRTESSLVSYVHISLVCQLLVILALFLIAVRGVNGKHKKY